VRESEDPIDAVALLNTVKFIGVFVALMVMVALLWAMGR
jgi:hypothetical protein